LSSGRSESAPSIPLCALDDIFILEVGQSIAVAWAGKLMAELGAAVIRADPPGGGRLARLLPLPGDIGQGVVPGAAWLHLNRGKQSVVIDGARQEAVLRRLIGRASVIVTDSATAEEMSPALDPADLRENHPSTIVTVISPFGLTGPYAGFAASELTVLALGGLLNMVGDPAREPLALGGHQAQYTAGLSAFSGTMAALYRRDRDKSGTLVDVSMLESVAFVEWKSGAFYQLDGEVGRRVGTRSQWMVLEAADGLVALVYQDEHFAALYDLTGLDELLDKRFSTRALRVRNARELREVLAPYFAARSKKDIYHAGQALRIPLGYVAEIPDLLTSPQYSARSYWETYRLPGGRDLTYPGTPYKLSGTSTRLGPPSGLGKHGKGTAI
jgi:crotonobetainyl-CoA:carnitine CoA-transferase CaiB-like acyl-CoA transferase